MSLGSSDRGRGPRRDAGPFGWPGADPTGRPRRGDDPASPWGRPDDLAAIEIRPRMAVAPDLVLRQLDPSPLGRATGQITEAPPLYQAMTAGAAALALGDESEQTTVVDGRPDEDITKTGGPTSNRDGCAGSHRSHTTKW